MLIESCLERAFLGQILGVDLVRKIGAKMECLLGLPTEDVVIERLQNRNVERHGGREGGDGE